MIVSSISQGPSGGRAEAAPQAGDAAAGKAKTGMCAACHGAAGISAVPMYPNLAVTQRGHLSTEPIEVCLRGMTKIYGNMCIKQAQLRHHIRLIV